jgi:holin-like protein
VTLGALARRGKRDPIVEWRRCAPCRRFATRACTRMTPGIEGAALETPTGIAVVPRSDLRAAAAPALLAVKRAALLGAEVAGLWALNKAGQLIVRGLHVHFPGNVAGMLLLFALLCTGVVPERLFERSSTLLARHLPFFFVPIAVGLMTLGDMVVSEGLPLLLVLVASAAVGLCLAGWLAQALAPPARKEQP